MASENSKVRDACLPVIFLRLFMKEDITQNPTALCKSLALLL